MLERRAGRLIQVARRVESGDTERMSERERSFQFGLRKLLLWTAVVAIWLGVLTMLPLGPPLSTLLTLWVVVVGVVRVAIRPLAAAFTSVVMAFGVALIHDYSGLLYYDDLHPPYMFVFPPAFGLYAVVIFAFVELALRAVNWVDNLMRTKSDGETRRD